MDFKIINRWVAERTCDALQLNVAEGGLLDLFRGEQRVEEVAARRQQRLVCFEQLFCRRRNKVEGEKGWRTLCLRSSTFDFIHWRATKNQSVSWLWRHILLSRFPVVYFLA